MLSKLLITVTVLFSASIALADNSLALQNTATLEAVIAHMTTDNQLVLSQDVISKLSLINTPELLPAVRAIFAVSETARIWGQREAIFKLLPSDATDADALNTKRAFVVATIQDIVGVGFPGLLVSSDYTSDVNFWAKGMSQTAAPLYLLGMDAVPQELLQNQFGGVALAWDQWITARSDEYLKDPVAKMDTMGQRLSDLNAKTLHYTAIYLENAENQFSL